MFQMLSIINAILVINAVLVSATHFAKWIIAESSKH